MKMDEITKKEKWFIIVALTFVLTTCYSIYQDEQQTMAKLKSGEKELYCAINSWERNDYIHPDDIVGHTDQGWIFTNGSASNCRLFNKGEKDERW
jgi:hypothetical protein